MEMDVKGLKAFKQGEKIDSGVLLPFEDDEIVWEAIAVGDGSRMTEARPKNHRFRFVEFLLTFLGVEIGRIMAEEQDDNTIRWSTIR
jgi:hypothetical protein